jgi:hypothetical protein
MRYINTPTVTFTDDNGTSYSIYDFREIPKYTTVQTMQRNPSESFDEIFTRREIAGDNMEAQSFMLHEANIQAVLDANFDYDKIRKLKIPAIGNAV